MRKLKLFSLALMALFSTGVWAAPVAGTYTTRTISNNDLTSSWAFNVVSGSAVKLGADPVTDNEMVFAPSAKDKIQFATSSYMSCQGQSSIYIPIPAGGAGSVSITMSSSSDSRYFQLYVNGTAGTEGQRLYSKLNAGGITADGKKGPQTFNFTASDLTTRDGKKYLHFKDNNTEMKVASFTIVLTTGTYATCTAPTTALSLTSDAAAGVYEDDEITFSTSGGNGGAITLEGSDNETISANKWIATAGEHTFTASQAMNGDYCAQEAVLVINVLEKTGVASCSISGSATANIISNVTYTATAANAEHYKWFVNDVEQGGDSAKFIFTADTKGTYNIVCKARNQYNTAGVWISSDPTELVVSKPTGELIKATLTSGSAATVTGVIGGTADVSLSSNKKMDNNKYFGVKLSSGSFLEGDTVNINITDVSGGKVCLFDDKSRTTELYLGSDMGVVGDNKIILPAAANGLTTLYVSRGGDYSWNPNLNFISVTRGKDITSIDTTLANVKIEGEAISAANLTTLKTSKSLDLADDYLDAPEVKFFRLITTTYDDATSSTKTDSVVITASVNGAGKWQARLTINEDTYTVTMEKTPSYSVTYKLGSRTLGSENVPENSKPTNCRQYQNQGNFATFIGWYDNSTFTGDSVTMAEATITQDTIFYAKFDLVYAESINIEQWILDNAKDSIHGEQLKALMGTRHYSTNIAINSTNGLDSLDNAKKDSLRNYDYLGLKIKTSGSLINFRVAEGKVAKIKFGAIAKAEKMPQVSINGGEYETVTLTDGVYTYNAPSADLISIKTVSGDAVVLKQIVIGDDPQLAVLMYGISYAETENGTVSGWKIAFPNETVKIYPAPASGYKITSVTANGDAIDPVNNKYSFTMPAAAVTVTATFSLATALDNTEAGVKAVKRLENGMLVIEKNGVRYNAMGQIIR